MKKKIAALMCCIGIMASIVSGCGNEKETVSRNTNSCEVQECSEDGTNEIVGISGNTEYYCDKHYKSLKAMAEEMFKDNGNDISESDSETEEDTEEIEAEIEEQESKVFQAYTAATNLTKDQLTKSGKGYSYNGMDLLSEDCDWINNNLNKEGTVNQGAIYRKMAKLLQGFEMKIAKYTDFSEMLIGFIPETRDGFAPYAKNAKTFITEENVILNIMKKFESLDCVKGTFDYGYGKLGKYKFKINDLKKCAEEMKISEEMLGYTIAMLDEYAPTIKFHVNTCDIVYKSKIKKISKKDFVATYDGKKHNILKEKGNDYIQYFAYDASVDESKEAVVKTNRGICIGNSRKEVFEKYGKSKEIKVDLDSNELYQYFLSENMTGLANLMQMQCHSYITYTYNEMSITFYFYESNKVSWIVYMT